MAFVASILRLWWLGTIWKEKASQRLSQRKTSATQQMWHTGKLPPMKTHYIEKKLPKLRFVTQQHRTLLGFTSNMSFVIAKYCLLSRWCSLAGRHQTGDIFVQ